MIEEHILKLPTPRLLTYFKKYYRGKDGTKQYLYVHGNISKEELLTWSDDYDIIKNELDRREHVEK